MPRPKIRPENRVRAYRACDACKTSKTRCDAKSPCANCIKKNRSNRCTYHAASTGRAGRRRLKSRSLLSPVADTNPQEEFPHGVPEPEDLISIPYTATGVLPSVSGGSSLSGNTPLSMPTADDIPVGQIPVGEESPQEHFVTGSNGEKFYIGENTSLSFLDYLRHSLRPWVGATSFTESERGNALLEPDIDEVAGEEVPLDLAEKRELFQSYCEVSSGILHLFDDAETESLLKEDTGNDSPPHNSEDIAAMDAALAIGAQARASAPRDSYNAMTLFTRARCVAFQDMLANPSLAIVRLCLLLSFYTLGASRQSAGSIYLGIASKAAVVLGLHQPMSWKSLKLKSGYGVRLRIWHSLCILEVLTSSLLGRPCTVPRATRHNVQSLPFDAEQPAFNAVLKGVVLLDDICCQLNRGVMNDIVTAQTLLQRLRTWSRDLPPSLRRFSYTNGVSMAYSDRKKAFGSIHVSSLYYFAVILVTRPFLIETFMTRMRQQSGLTSQGPVDPQRASLAQVCMISAMHMGHLCRQVASVLTASDLPFGNLGLFKSWAFGSGLVLGFSIFAGESQDDLRGAFTGVINLLETAGAASPQSRVYSKTLYELEETINLYQHLASRKARCVADQYVDEILIIDTGQDMSMSSMQGSGPQFFSPRQGADLNTNMEMSNHMVQTEMDAELFVGGWEDLGYQFSDNFALDFGVALL
ncbi:Fungal transcriptional regulatory protein, N-terminal [Penicillium camemberti]|uniref:Fungal transcriptional regulatory protein, N-terminal n=1 Tax=Penicillium camemberti (strain FM 013) TaxID=1429867 RepID=A0A0G4PI84_PENC3|nr:Fungal transcriptional regulatory protein, N-terminal [Penicillium camemberti]